MISFRTHVVTLVSVFLALAVGVVLGGGPLSEVGRGGSDSEDVAELRTVAAEDARRAEAADRFAGAAAAPLYAGRLTDRQVAVVTLPGADDAVVEALTGQLVAAGGAVSVVQPVAPTLLNPAEKSLVDTLGTQLAAQLPAGAVPPEATTYDRIGHLLGLTLAAKDAAGQAPDGRSAAVLESLLGADLLAEAPARERRAPLVLVVLGDEVDGEGGDALLAAFLRGLGGAAAGIVVAAEDGSEGSQLARLRSDDSLAGVTSVDEVDAVTGQVAATLGLIRALTTSGGAFGASGADGALPLG
ncbi:copper transporter [Nocardioides solisilvae]|uniref:copper transporter n=1 Tax=Nocardioides solisilvae TaxID=1542435 RepID=UPI0013A56241|nr:copper transporter [Nocardioides solisilvae]